MSNLKIDSCWLLLNVFMQIFISFTVIFCMFFVIIFHALCQCDVQMLLLRMWESAGVSVMWWSRWTARRTAQWGTQQNQQFPTPRYLVSSTLTHSISSFVFISLFPPLYSGFCCCLLWVFIDSYNLYYWRVSIVGLAVSLMRQEAVKLGCLLDGKRFEL